MATTVDLGNVIGPQGPKGDTGPAGAGWFLLFLGQKGSEASSTIDTSQLQQLQAAYPYVIMQNADGEVYLPCDKYEYNYAVPASLDASEQTQDATTHTAIKFTRTVTSQSTTEKSTQDVDNVFTVDLDTKVCWYSSELSLPLQNTTVYWDDIKDNPVAKFITNISSGLFIYNRYNASMLYGCTCASVCKDMDHNIVTSLPTETCELLKTAWPYCFVIAPTHVSIQSVGYSYTLCVPVFSGGYSKDGTSTIGGWYPDVNTGATQSTTQTCMYFKSVHTDVDGNYAVYKIDYVTGAVSTFIHSAVAASANSVDWSNVQNKPDAATKEYVDGRTAYELALGVLYTQGAALNTQKTYVGFPNITIRTSIYDKLYEYIVTQGKVVESVIFYVPKLTTGQNVSFQPNAIQTFQVSHFKRTLVNGVLNFSIVADCFINDGIVQNASSTVLNLGRITLSMNSKTTILMDISSSSAMSLASSNNLYILLLTFSKSLS